MTDAPASHAASTEEAELRGRAFAEQLANAPSFREAFCGKFHCPAEKFAARALWRCVPPHAKLLAAFVQVSNPEHFQPDLDLIRRVGSATSISDVKAELREFQYDNLYRHIFLRQTLRVRVSSRRLLKLAAELWR